MGCAIIFVVSKGRWVVEWVVMVQLCARVGNLNARRWGGDVQCASLQCASEQRVQCAFGALGVVGGIGWGSRWTEATARPTVCSSPRPLRRRPPPSPPIGNAWKSQHGPQPNPMSRAGGSSTRCA